MKFYDLVSTDKFTKQVVDIAKDLDALDANQLDQLHRHQEIPRQILDMAGFVPHLPEAVVFDVSNVSAYVMAHGFDAGTIPCWIPPYPVTWWETAKVHDGPYTRLGALALTREYQQAVGGAPGGRETHWDVNWLIFITESPTGNTPFLYAPETFIYMCLGPDGQPLIGHEGYSLNNGAWKLLQPFLMAIGFSHCKNVELIDGPMPPVPVRRKQERKLGAPLVKYKELVIDPSITEKRYAEPRHFRDDHKHQKALHIARGHFAHYTEDKPLFGKYAGTFWRPAHVRGSAEVGTVYKDYKVKAA